MSPCSVFLKSAEGNGLVWPHQYKTLSFKLLLEADEFSFVSSVSYRKLKSLKITFDEECSSGLGLIFGNGVSTCEEGCEKQPHY